MIPKETLKAVKEHGFRPVDYPNRAVIMCLRLNDIRRDNPDKDLCSLWLYDDGFRKLVMSVAKIAYSFGMERTIYYLCPWFPIDIQKFANLHSFKQYPPLVVEWWMYRSQDGGRWRRPQRCG